MICNFKIEKLSVTDLKMAKTCEKKLFFKFTRPKPDKIGVYLLIGIVFHYVVAEYLKNKLKSGKDMTLNELEDFFKRTWELYKVNGDWEKMSELESSCKCWQYLVTYHKKRLKLLFPAKNNSIERFFTFIAKEGENRLKFIGKIDLFTIDGTLLDHKTSGRGWTQEEADRDPQAHFYPFALRVNGVNNIQKFAFNVVTPADVTVFEVVPEENEFMNLVSYGFQLQRNFVENNISITSNPTVCKWCDYKNICESSLVKDIEVEL